jgi:hypothetical protein
MPVNAFRTSAVKPACLIIQNQDKERSLRINASRRGRSSSPTAVNFRANPRPGSIRRTRPSALIWTRNSRLAVEPTPLDACVSRNRPPRLIFRTRETSRIQHSANRPTHPRASRFGSGTSLNGKGIAATCTTTACGLFRDGGIRKYAGRHGRESL